MIETRETQTASEECGTPSAKGGRTSREERLLVLMAAGRSARGAALQAGYTESYADVITARRPDLVESARERARAALEEAGATVEKAVKVYAAALEAVDGDGRPDHAARQRAADRVLGLWGVATKAESPPTGSGGPQLVQNNLIFAAQASARERLRQLILEGEANAGSGARAALGNPAVAGRLLEALGEPPAANDDSANEAEEGESQ